MSTPSILRYCLLLVLVICPGIGVAGIQVGGTRIVFPSTDHEASIQVRNEGAEDIMIQSWIEAAPNEADKHVPFAITPSLARLSFKKQQMLRIFYQGKGLPEDHESVFWLNVQEIPQLLEADNNLQVAFRQRLKLFYRPAGLPGTPDEAANDLQWALSRTSGELMLSASNASGFHVSLGVVSVLAGGKKYAVEAQMVNPKSSAAMKVSGLPLHVKGELQVQWDSINDYGALVKHQTLIAF